MKIKDFIDTKIEGDPFIKDIMVGPITDTKVNGFWNGHPMDRYNSYRDDNKKILFLEFRVAQEQNRDGDLDYTNQVVIFITTGDERYED